MKLTKKQLHDFKQIIKRKWCQKPTKACGQCAIACCRDSVWTIHYSGDDFTYVGEKEINKAESLIKQHYMTIAAKILLEEDA